METKYLFLPLLIFMGSTNAVYKQWIPSTNFENASNWNEQRVPCSQDTVMFDSGKKVSVYVQASHSLKDMYLPLDGEFILSPGAGFAASAEDDAECSKGSTIMFRDTDQDTWLDPTLWLSGLSTDDLEGGKSLFLVDAERVPCQYDDVIFFPETSFRVNIQPTDPAIQLKSISVMGRRFNRDDDFSQYRQSNTGKLQFPGPGRLQITNAKCGDKTGCECGNDLFLGEICSSLLRHYNNKCPEVPCTNPLQPVGHCCEICGATVSLEHTSQFDLENYRNRLTHTFLSLNKYSSVKLAISKVQKLQTVLGIIPRGSIPEIQIVIIDDKNGSQTGSDAQQLAYDIMSDIQNHGQSFGIIKGTLVLATGSSTSAHKTDIPVGTIFASVIGVIICVALIGATYFLYRTGFIRLPSLDAVTFRWMRNRTQEGVAHMERKGFENPIFDGTPDNSTDVPPLYEREEAPKGIVVRQSDVHFTNPLYDGSPSEF
ncbi:amnion associated transmembrane protein L homeolog precursor [Xenopus laevis]|uniref:Protein amnionless n=2 Tax=Xenopus laevis TaxID=8355 RepID=A0A8J0PWY0_XENLA|nr:amnion associated transmembrane protein L homeolog precursor [Xenopus laevis]